MLYINIKNREKSDSPTLVGSQLSSTICNITILEYIIVYIHSQRHFPVTAYTDFSNPVVKHDTEQKKRERKKKERKNPFDKKEKKPKNRTE